jgi:hypothetical protein
MNGQWVKLVETVVKTKKGTVIKRYKNNVGKQVGSQLYVHKNYAGEVVPKERLEKAQNILKQNFPNFAYNCLMHDSSNGDVRFDEAPDFDTAREPVVGNMVTIKSDGVVKTAKSNMIWHHKWLWVKDDYTGFDLDESKKWSQLWASKLEGIAKGNKEGFSQQLQAIGLI